VSSLRWWALLGVLALLSLALWRLVRSWLDHAAARTVYRFRSRVDRFKLTRRRVIIAELLRDPAIAAAVRAHALEHGLSEETVWQRVRGYLDEIIPFFNILAYYRVGYVLSRALLNLLYKVSVHYARPDPFRALPRDAIVLYVMNHRSNADYVLVGYALAGEVAISYAVGEWARAFPLEYIFKSFGSYFIRRRYREALYHAVLERYVQLITTKGVTQGVFPEWGLTRDGALQPAKIGLLDYVLGVARDAECRQRMYVIPVAINYDRVLEDRSLLREHATRTEGASQTPRLVQLYEVLRYVGWNAMRLVTGRWQRYGRAAVMIGEPWSVNDWLREQEAAGNRLFDLPRAERLGRVQALADRLMQRVGELIPVTPVVLACVALDSFPSEFVGARQLLDRMEELREVLQARGAFVVRDDLDIAEVFDRAYRMLRMRRIIARQGSGYLVLPAGRPLIQYYRNSVSHLIGSYVEGVRVRDQLPAVDPLGRQQTLHGPGNPA
jgi:glycerol-3-phosphate O-acyltransferase